MYVEASFRKFFCQVTVKKSFSSRVNKYHNMKLSGGVGLYLQEFLTPLSEDRQPASGPGHFTRRKTSVTHGTGTDLLQQKRSAVG